MVTDGAVGIVGSTKKVANIDGDNYFAVDPKLVVSRTEEKLCPV